MTQDRTTLPDELVGEAARAVCYERNGKIRDCDLGCSPDTGCMATSFNESDAEYRYARAAIEAVARPSESRDTLHNELVEKVGQAIEAARCNGREGPFGGYDYGHDTDFYGPAPEGGRYVIRDFRDPGSPDWGKWLHQTNDREEHEKLFAKMTRDHIARAAIEAASLHAEPNALREALKRARWYVNDSLEASYSSDAQETLDEIDAALNTPVHTKEIK
jgi:hypothetical protein